MWLLKFSLQQLSYSLESELTMSGISTSLPHEHNHTVQFYGDDGALLHELMSHIGKALMRGSSAIVIATSAHIDGLAHKLKSRGVDLAKAKAESRYIALEASHVLSKFMVAGLPNRVLFSDAIGQVISRAASASLDENRRVVAFGEMVALLWAEGKYEAAIQLEKLWNELAKTYSFSLHCAYPMQGFSRQEMEDSLRKICAQHSGVVLDGSLAQLHLKVIEVSPI
jgi:MEDS: MEthanogen/methylotroph, DcmR Sensory domain